MGVKKLKQSVAPAVRHRKKIVKKRNHLKLVKSSSADLDSFLANRSHENIEQKRVIAHYQEVIAKTLEDPEMVKKAALLLVEMLEK
jgi:hypothetical protein